MSSSGPWRAPAKNPAPAGPGQSGQSDPSGQPARSGQAVGSGDAAGSSGDLAPAQHTAPAPPAEPAGPPPEDVHTAWVLWLAATAFALVGMVLNALTSQFEDMPVATRDAVRDAAEKAGDAAPSVDTVFGMAMMLGAGLAVLASAVTVWLAFRLRAGKGWARTMLDIVAIFLVVDAVAVVIGVFAGTPTAGSRSEGLTFTIFCFQILAGLCAGTAVWRQHTVEAMKFTTRDGTSGKD